jgi:hypothetical protein
MFPNSDLSDAFNIAYKIGCKYIFLMNVRQYADYIDIVDTIRHYDFAYIVPLGVKFSDRFYNSVVERTMTFSEYFLTEIGGYTNSTIIMTDSHASLYEDIDVFLDDMFDKIGTFKLEAQQALQNGRNLCLIANNLNDYKNAALVLASIMCEAKNADYPDYEVGEAIFEINSNDVGAVELAYFKNNHLKNSTVENLKNFRTENDPAKLVPIDMVIKFIDRTLDFSEFRGKNYNEYVRLQIYSMLNDELTEMMGVMIRDFTINDVSPVSLSPGECYIVNDFSISPINSIEEFNIVMEV